MAGKLVSLRYHYEGVFKFKNYLGGQTFCVNRFDLDKISYPEIIDYVKDDLKYEEIGGVYVWGKKTHGWKLLTCDADVIELLNGSKPGEEINLYVDTIVDKQIEPMKPGVPSVVIRPRKNIVAAGVTSERVSRTFVTSYQLQQKKNKKIPRSPQLQDLRQVPMNTRGNTKRKLILQNDTNVEKERVNAYELNRLKQVQENKRKFEQLGLKNYASKLNQPSIEESKTNEKDGEESDAYVVENDSGADTNDSSERIQNVKERISTPGPRTRSRANATDLGDKETVHKEGKQVATPTEKEVPGATGRAKLLKPTCSKLLKVFDNGVPSGSVAAYIALRERQKQNLEHGLMVEGDVGESSLQITDEEVETGPKKCRGRSKMYKAHARKPNEKVVIEMSKRGQPIGERKIKSEFSNFLGTLVKDHVSITYVNWHVVPEETKEWMLKYTLERYIIPPQGEKWVLGTLNALWRTHKSRMKKKYYTQYDSNEERILNRPDHIPLEDFKLLLKYWSDDGVQSLAEDNTARRKSYIETHTLGPKSLAELRNDLKNKHPNNASPSDAKMYLKSRKRKPGRNYKSNPAELNKKLKSIEDMVKEGNEAAVMLPRKKNRPDWLVGRQGKSLSSTASTASPIPDTYVEQLTEKITQNVESEMESKFNKKLQENMAWFVKKLGEANPEIKLDFTDFFPTVSSDADENGTPSTPATQRKSTP